MDKLWGFLFLATYIFAVGIGSFLQKFVMNKVSPYQLEVITAFGMFAISVPALLFVQKNLHIPVASAPLALLVGLFFSLGSFVYVLAVSKLPVSVAAPVSTGYVVVAVILSIIFLKEPITLLKVLGILLTVVGVAILSI
ncbi:MAG TPA: DMT family transporter [Patescibacteria group bacterium]|nr:DMT family transporter [Patescibacteria group bacterium]